LCEVSIPFTSSIQGVKTHVKNLTFSTAIHQLLDQYLICRSSNCTTYNPPYIHSQSIPLHRANKASKHNRKKKGTHQRVSYGHQFTTRSKRRTNTNPQVAVKQSTKTTIEGQKSQTPNHSRLIKTGKKEPSQLASYQYNPSRRKTRVLVNKRVGEQAIEQAIEETGKVKEKNS
jgi:hypothetical protein